MPTNRWLLIAVLLSGCVPATLAGIRREAVDRLADCANDSPSPIAMKDQCLPDVLAYCAKNHVACDGEQLWHEAEGQLGEGWQ
jgi:hypothetical protein